MGYRDTWIKSYENRLENYDSTVISLHQKIADTKREKEELIKLMMIEPETLEEIMCKKYIECGRLNDLCIWLNDNGYRTEGHKENLRKYTSNDVSNQMHTQWKNKENRFGVEALKLFKINNTVRKNN